MRTLITISLSLLSLLTTPVAAADFRCPAVVNLPTTLNLSPNGQAITPHQQRMLQTYLNNLQTARNAYQNTNRKAVKDQLTNCMLIHLASLSFNQSLLAPRTKADLSTWQLMHQEATNTLNMVNPLFLRRKYQVGLIAKWLATKPNDITPLALASR